MEVRLDGREVHVVLRDANSLAIARGVVETLGGPLRGSDAVGAGAVVPWNAVVHYLLDVQARVMPVSQGPLTDQPTDQRRTIVQRALRSRMGRRGANRHRSERRRPSPASQLPPRRAAPALHSGLNRPSAAGRR